MWDLGIAFDNPWWPWLIALLVFLLGAMWYWSFRSLSGLGSYRRIFALLFRSAVLTLIILSLADIQLLRKNQGLTVIYLLDQSASVPAEQRRAMLTYVVEEVETHRDDAQEDRASVIVFGREANIEVPPLDDDLPLYGRLESAANLRTDATNLEAAMKLAQATFPEDTAKRLVLVSDGNENMGRAENIAAKLSDEGVSIDVLPVQLTRRAEVAVERVAIPSDIRKGEPFNATVVVNNLTPVTTEDDGVVSGRLKLERRQGKISQTLSEEQVKLDPGKSVFRFTDDIEDPDFYEYQATFTADDAEDDLLTQNNLATGFTYVRGKGNVLLIEDWENRDPSGNGEFAYLIDRLRANNIEVTLQFTDELFTSLAELQRYDAVILGNVPKSSGTNSEDLSNFSDRQIEMLVHNTREMGCGLIMLGGPNAFGAGGWANTELEKAMPVDFQIRNTKIQAVGALVMIMHASELAEGNYWQKVIGREALKSLGPQDYCGVVHWESSTFKEDWLWGKPKGLIKVGGNRPRMISKMDRMAPGDMPDFDSAMRLAAAAFSQLRAAAVKHMIIISDGDPTPPSTGVLSRLKKLGVKVSTVAVGTHGPPGSTPLKRISTYTGGKYYVVRNPKALPKIYQREARRVARPLIVERELQPQVSGFHDILEGVEGMPPTRGFVMTTVKGNPLVETPLISPYPVNVENASLLSTWQFGLGRSVAFTSDAGHKWATDWTGWEGYDKFFTQLVRWAMRPSGDTGNFTISTQTKDGKVKVVVDALDKNDEFLNFLGLNAALIGPTMEPQAIDLRQDAPGRYVGEFEAGRSGSYFLTVSSGAERAPIRAGINVPYSAEFRDRETNQALLENLASLQPKGGNPGKVIPVRLDTTGVPKVEKDQQEEFNTFRRDVAPTVSSNYIWPWLILLSGVIFFGDVFIRRVAVEFGWLVTAVQRVLDAILRREKIEAPNEAMARLQSRKAEIAGAIDQRRAATTFEPEPDQDVDVSVLDAGATATPIEPKRDKKASDLGSVETAEDDFATRLLKAKKKALGRKTTTRKQRWVRFRTSYGFHISQRGFYEQ